MKKSAIALGVIVALGAIWTGAAWYTGKIAEQELTSQVAIMNQELAKSNTGYSSLHVENLHIERGLFSSKTRYELVFTESNKKQQAYYRIPIEGTLYHGPLPLNQLQKFNFTPLVLSSEDQAIKTAENAAFFPDLGDQAPFSSVFTIDYEQNLSWEYKLPSFSFSTPSNTSILKGITGKYTLNKAQESAMDVHLEHAILRMNDASDRLAIIHGANVKTHYSPAEPWDKLFTGWVEIGAESFRLENTNLSQEYKNAQFKTQATRTNDFLDINLHFGIDDTLFNDQPTGLKTELNAQGEHIDGNALNAIMQIDEEKVIDSEIFLNNLEKILQNQPHLVVESKLENSQGASNLKLDTSIANVNYEAALNKGQVFKLFNHLNLQANLNKANLTDTLARFLQLVGIDQARAKQLAQAKLEAELSNAVKNGILVDNGNNATLNLALQNNILTLNGHVIPEEQAAMFLLFLVLGMGGY